MNTTKLFSILLVGFCLSTLNMQAQKVMPTPQTARVGLKDFMDAPALLANFFGDKKSNYKEETVYNIDDSFKAYAQNNQEYYTIQKVFDLSSGTKPEKLVAINIFGRDDDFYSSPEEKKKIKVQNSHASGPSLLYGIYRSDGKLWFLVKKSSKKFNNDHENFGSYGYPEDLNVVSYGKGHTALVENTGDYAQGIAVQGINFLDVFTEKKVLGLSAETSGSTINGNKDFAFDYKVTPILSEKEYYDLVVNFSGTNLDSSRKKVIPYNKTVTYIFDTAKGKYVLKK